MNSPDMFTQEIRNIKRTGGWKVCTIVDYFIYAMDRWFGKISHKNLVMSLDFLTDINNGIETCNYIYVTLII